MTEKWWPEACDDWAKEKIKKAIGGQVMTVLSCMHAYWAGVSVGRSIVAQDAAMLYWIEERTRQCAKIFGEEVPGYAGENK